MSVPAYPSYRDSGVEWLGDVPRHWEVAPLKRLLDIQNGADHKHVEQKDGYPVIGSGGPFTFASDYLFDGESVLLGRKGTINKPLYVTGRFWTVDTMYWSKIRPCTNGRFAFYTATTIPFTYYSTSTALPSMTQTALNGHFIARPPLSEQVIIAAFLDRETAKIDALIEEQRRLIALLKEKRQAVIAHAVTKGLDPHARMKDSGIEWLGEVPAHWEVRLLSSVSTKITNGYVGPTRDILRDDGVRYLQSLHIKSNTIRFETPYFVSQEWSEAHAKSILEAGDVLIVQTGDIGQSAVVTSEFEGCNCHALIIVSPLRSVLSGDWLAWLLNGAYGFNSLLAIQTGALHPHLNCGNVKGLAIPIAPLSEQADIVDYIAIETSRFGELSTEAQRGIDLLTERRAALISAAVTGKIDVRGSANVLSFPIDRVRARGLIAIEIIERSAHQTTFGRVKFQKIAFLAEAHVGINELAGSYTREAAGPLDRTLIDEMESGAHSVAGIEHEQPGGPGTAVSYRLGGQPGAHRQELADWLGAERTAKLDKMIANCASLNTKQAEAVATLYGVWNDALLEGASPTDDEIISGFLNDWHPEKREKFRSSDLPEWLGWMRRHGVVPTGSGPKTTTGRFFV